MLARTVGTSWVAVYSTCRRKEEQHLSFTLSARRFRKEAINVFGSFSALICASLPLLSSCRCVTLSKASRALCRSSSARQFRSP